MKDCAKFPGRVCGVDGCIAKHSKILHGTSNVQFSGHTFNSDQQPRTAGGCLLLLQTIPTTHGSPINSFLTTLQTKMYCIGIIDKEGKKEDILDISSDITHIKLDKVIHNFIDLKVRLDQVERPTGKIDIFNVYHRKTFVHLSHVYICMYYFNMIL